MKLSIITVNLNNVAGLGITVKSVLSQSFNNFEYLIIDGGSKDGSLELIKEYAQKLTYWISESDNGIYHAMNKGIEKAKGEYCLFLNSGDYFYNNEVLLKVFSSISDVDIIYGDILCTDLKKITFLSKSIPEISLKRYLLRGIPHSASFIKTTLFDRFGNYNESLSISADFEFFLKTLIIEKVSYKYVSHTISVFNLNGISNQKMSVATSEISLIIDQVYSKDLAEIIKEYIDLKYYIDNINRNRLIQLSLSLTRNKTLSRILNKLLKATVKVPPRFD